MVSDELTPSSLHISNQISHHLFWSDILGRWNDHIMQGCICTSEALPFYLTKNPNHCIYFAVLYNFTVSISY